jgi:uncharacterized protein (DUF2336 family)
MVRVLVNSLQVEQAPGLDVTVFETVLAFGTLEQKKTLVRQLAAFIDTQETPALEREQVLPILLKLATDEAREVRELLALELASVQDLHQDMIFAVIADEDDIALPFLAQTPALNAWHMQAILRVGDENRQRTIAAREDIVSETVQFAVKAGSAAALATLLQNPAAQFSAHDMRLIYQRLGNAGEVVESLLARNDLPLDIRITQAKRAAVRMRQLMAERGWMPANDANDLVADAEEGAVLAVLRDARGAERGFAIHYLASHDLLTPSLIVRAACLGAMDIVASALAHLCGQHPERVLATILHRGGSGVRGMFSKAMLPYSCHAIIASACDVAAQAREEDVRLNADTFGRRLLELLMLQFGALGARDQAKLMDYVGRFADEKVRKIARRLKSDMMRAA